MTDAYTLKNMLMNGDKSQAVYLIRQVEKSHPYLEIIADFLDSVEKWKSINNSRREFLEDIKDIFRRLEDSLDEAKVLSDQAYETIIKED